ncbi:MAG: hypothetical protein JWP76_2868 [Dactylosporangium sp.]|nr:hypothetical protein [Dactylosporangium sp.]
MSASDRQLFVDEPGCAAFRAAEPSQIGHLHRAGLLRHHASSTPVVAAKLPRRQRVVQLVSTRLLTLRRPLWPRGRSKCCGKIRARPVSDTGGR